MAVVEQDVLRLDVAVDDCAVGVLERVGDLAGELERVPERELLFPLQPVPQRLAFHVRHDVVEEARRLRPSRRGQDVGMMEPGGDLDFAEEPLGAERGGELGVQDLDGDVTVVPRSWAR